ncbi:TPA: hypothetical protein ACQ39K_004915, partial [Yersinia enterocolitica]
VDNVQPSEDVYLSISFTVAIGFIVFLAYTSFMGRYLSLPLSVRENSLIVGFFKRKVKLYALSWMVLNFIVGVIVILIGLNPFFLSGLSLVSVILFVFFSRQIWGVTICPYLFRHFQNGKVKEFINLKN